MANITPFPQQPVRPRRRPRGVERIEPGIDRTPTGYRAWVYVKGEPFTKRWPFVQRLPDGRERKTTITEVRDWRAATRTAQLTKLKKRDGKPIAPGTFAEDVLGLYLPSVTAMPTYHEREKHMREWLALLGADRTTESITAIDVQTALQTLRLNGKPLIAYARDADGQSIRKVTGHGPYSESAVNNRRTALMHFFTKMNGKSGRNPVRDVAKFQEPDPQPRGKSMQTVQQILDGLAPSKTKARLSVIAWTGIPHATLIKVEPDHVDYAAGTVFLHGRKKGKGTKARVLKLLPQAVDAFTLMRTWDAWGSSERRVDPDGTPRPPRKRAWGYLAKAVGRACRRLRLPVMTAYDFRHSFATATYKASKDINATGRLIGHSDARLTRRYALGAEDPNQVAALDALAAAHPLPKGKTKTRKQPGNNRTQKRTK